MSLIVEDGTGRSDAESYISVADADTYHTKFTASAAWAGAGTADKETALRQATQYLDDEYRGRWKGYPVDDEQALAWPRLDVEDENGYVVDSDAVPEQVQRAAAEMALRALSSGPNLLPDIVERGTVKSIRKKLGPMEKEVEYVGGGTIAVSGQTNTHFQKVYRMLIGLIRVGGRVERG